MSGYERRDDWRAAAAQPESGPGRGAERGAGLRDEEDLHILPGPGLDEDELVRERMEIASPDGRPPPRQIRRETRRMFFLALTIAAVVVLVAIYSWGGPGPTAVALVLWGVFIGLAAWPTWHAGLDRKAEENRARRDLAAERRGVTRREPDRRVSGG
jgi:hypothetical protein